jgi:hypothetical protein
MFVFQIRWRKEKGVEVWRREKEESEEGGEGGAEGGGRAAGLLARVFQIA